MEKDTRVELTEERVREIVREESSAGVWPQPRVKNSSPNNHTEEEVLDNVLAKQHIRFLDYLNLQEPTC